jgi:rhodanese-related sulfurtransferase
MLEARRVRAQQVVVGLLLIAAAAISGCGGVGAGPGATVAATGPATASAAATTLPLTVGVAQAAALKDRGAFVLDVREPNEWATGHIRGATLIPLGQLADRTGEVPRDRTVVVVCHTGNRSAQGRDILRQAGFTNVTSMTGGMAAWIAAGLPIQTGS